MVLEMNKNHMVQNFRIILNRANISSKKGLFFQSCHEKKKQREIHKAEKKKRKKNPQWVFLFSAKSSTRF